MCSGRRMPEKLLPCVPYRLNSYVKLFTVNDVLNLHSTVKGVYKGAL